MPQNSKPVPRLTTVTDVDSDGSFSDTAHFSRTFKQAFNAPPPL